MTPATNTILLSRSAAPELNAVQYALRTELFRRYRTRHIAVNPPAQATTVYAPGLGIQELGGADLAAVVFLPTDMEPALASLARSQQEVLVQPDIGLASQNAYLSLSAPAPAGGLPLNVWLDLAELVRHWEANAASCQQPALPIVLAAGDSVALAEFAPTDAHLDRMHKVIAAAQRPTAALPEQDAEKARQKAARYGERPWLFMRYEMRAGYQRRAVHWAPFADSLPPCVLE